MGSRGTALITMELAALILILAAAASGQRHQVDEVLKSEIEQAASESRHLADELAGMLDRLEIEEDRSAAVNAAVLGEQEEVEAALKVMVEKIENLAQASEESSSETVSGLVKKKRVKEQELRKTLEQLELVASQIEEAADTADSIEEVDTIEKIAKLLQSISNKVEANNEDDDDEEVFRRQFAKDQSQTGLELNGIAEMIKSLEKVTKDLTEDDEDDSEDEDDSSRRAQKLVDDVKSGKLGRRSRGRGQRPRGGKQIDLGLESDKGSLDSTANRLLDVLNLEEIEEANKSSGPDKSSGERSGKSEEPEDSEECEGKTSEDRIRVCLPKPTAKGTPVKLPTAKIEEEAVCLDVSRAICNETSAVLSREVCTYQYNQADVLAPVQSAELTFRPRVEKLGVTRCHVVPEKHGYRTVEVEKCVMEFIDAPYILPDIAIKVDDFLQLQLPEPEKRCSVFNYELPEVLCGEHTRHQCVNVAHLIPYQVTEHADTVGLGYGGSCNSQTLSQEQKICTITKHVKRPQAHYGGY